MTSYGETRLTAAPRANFVDDMSQVAGLIMVYGFIPFVTAIRDLAGVAGEDVDWNGEERVFPPILDLLASLTVTLFGLSSIFIGFQYLTSKWGSTTLSLFGLLITLAAWFPFLVTVSKIAFQADNRNLTGPPLLIPFAEPKNSEVWAIAIMGILGFYGYAGTVIGALTFLHWKMYRYFAGYSTTYSASYYRSRMGYYGFISVMEGLVQLSLGAYIMDHFGEDGQLDAPVVAGPFFIMYPEISVTVGVCQVLMGLYMWYRSTTSGVGPSTGDKDHGLFWFQLAAWSVCIMSIGCQVLGQVSLAPTNDPALFAGNVLGFCLFPIYLDVMAHTTPENVTSDMLSLTKTLGSGV